MDAGKSIACLAKQELDNILTYCFVPQFDEKNIDFSSLFPKAFASSGNKIIAIPTTSGTASETNSGAVISDDTSGTHRKLIFASQHAKASSVILNSEITVGVPRYPTATCGMYVLMHAIEAFISDRQNPYAHAVAIGSIKLVAENLRAVLADPKNVVIRKNMHVASHMAGVAFSIAPLGIVHAMGHPLSAMYNQVHGQTLATLLQILMRFNMPARADKYEVAKAFGVWSEGATDEENGENAAQAVIQLSKDVDTARSIGSYSKGQFEQDPPELVRQTSP